MALGFGSKYFNFPNFTAAEWTTRNPLLLTGEVGFEKHPLYAYPWRYKAGPGRWIDLPYQYDSYPYIDPVTNELGDAAGILQYMSVPDILKLILSPYQVPALSVPLINVNGLGYAPSHILEIGQSITSPVLISASIDLPANLHAGTPYHITAGGVFTNEGDFASPLPASLTLATLTPTEVTDILISLKALGGNSVYSNILTALIGVYPKIIWGVSSSPTIIPTNWTTLTNVQTLITKSFENEYSFILSGSSYFWLAVPQMLNPGSAPFFADVTNPIAPGPITMLDNGIQSINNGVGTYNYQTFRSQFLMTGSTIVQMQAARSDFSEDFDPDDFE